MQESFGRAESFQVYGFQTMSIIVGLCFYGTAKVDQTGIQSVQGALFTVIAVNHRFFQVFSSSFIEIAVEFLFLISLGKFLHTHVFGDYSVSKTRSIVYA